MMSVRSLVPLIFFAGATLALPSCVEQSESEILSRYVNPFVGTAASGHTFPGAAYPLGLVQLSPNTGNYDWEYHSGYQYRDTTLRGFAHTHLNGGGNPALGDVLMLPFYYDAAIEKECVPFSKDREEASPGYYTTFLTEDEIGVELSVTKHTGIHRYTFQKRGTHHLLINLDEVLFRANRNRDRSRVEEAWFDIESDTIVNGYLRTGVKGADRKVFFSAWSSEPFYDHRFIDDTLKRKLLLDLIVDSGDEVEVRVGISGVGVDGAKKNLRAESVGKSFEEIKKAAEKAWNGILSRITLEGTSKQKIQFYTSMYHLFIQPNIVSDVDGRYRGADLQVYQAPAGGMYSTFAFWDTYRAANPLYSILVPDKFSTFVGSVLEHYNQAGYLPVWALWAQDTKTMIGNHSVPTVVEACLKEIQGVDHEEVYEAVKATLTKNSWSKYDWSIYDQYGYLPYDKVRAESVSRTLEATYDDWCAAQLAKKLGKEEDYRFFMQRSNYYRNLLDSKTKMMRGRDSGGNWREPFNPIAIEHAGTTNGDYTEGNAWQYTWHVQHDIPGLIELMGGREFFLSRLDTLFSMHSMIVGEGSTLDVSGHIGQYAHGNEPSQHIAYLYNYAGRPDKTQKMVHRIISTMYDTTPAGYCGNNDFGQMSAWYILSTLGFYPVNPASGMFDIGAPAHPYAAIHFADKKFEIIARDVSDQNIYVQSVSLNGHPLKNHRVSYEQIMQGGKLIFQMGSDPR